MKLKSVASNLLKNKMVLNIVSVIALINVLGYMMMGEIDLVLFYIILAVVIKHFSHNMIVVLGVPIILINFISLKKLKTTVEGMETNENDTDIKEKKNTETVAEINKQKLQKVSTDTNNDGVVSSNVADKTKSGFEVGRKKGGSKIDYAATIEDSYDQLNKILGSDGIKNLTADTQRLMQQQLDLSDSMNSMKPLIEGIMPMADKLQGMMKSMDVGESGGLGGIMDMANKMSAGLKDNKSPPQ